MSEHAHFIERCIRCDGVITQCRCMDRNKTTLRRALCSPCQLAGWKVNEGMVAAALASPIVTSGGHAPTEVEALRAEVAALKAKLAELQTKHDALQRGYFYQIGGLP